MKKHAKQTARINLEGRVPESWACVDCGVNTAPGILNRMQLEQALMRDLANQGVTQTYDERTEVYLVKPAVWKAARLGPMGGCLCIGCLENRIGRTLAPKDFLRRHPLNLVPGTERLIERRGGPWEPPIIEKF